MLEDILGKKIKPKCRKISSLQMTDFEIEMYSNICVEIMGQMLYNEKSTVQIKKVSLNKISERFND